MKRVLLFITVLVVGIAAGTGIGRIRAQSPAPTLTAPTVTLGAQSVPSGRHLTAKEWRSLVDSDPVLQFAEQVTKTSPKHLDWETCYPCAIAKTFEFEYRDYLIRKYRVGSYEVGF